MKNIGIIAEFNPFHKGHKYLIDYARNTLNADNVIVIMSGDFVQRGDVAIVDKYTRAKDAIKNGADLVVELPCVYATSSAQNFALGAVSHLDKMNIVDTLLFGCEVDDINTLNKLGTNVSSETPDFKDKLNSYLKQGLSYPKAYINALCENSRVTNLQDVSNMPNLILGISYISAIKSLKSNIKPVCIKRIGSDYNSGDIDSDFPSAKAIRNVITNENNKNKIYNIDKYLTKDCLDSILYEKILSSNSESISNIYGINEFLANKIINNLNSYQGFDSYAKLLNSKDTIYAQISRGLLHFILGITSEDMNLFLNDKTSYYYRVLGIKKEKLDLIKSISDSSHLPIIGTLSQVCDLSDMAGKILSIDTKASNLYEGLMSIKYKTNIINEYNREFSVY